MTKHCIICNRSFSKTSNTSQKMWLLQKYCSNPCRHKGHGRVMKGTTHTVEARRKISIALKGRQISKEWTEKRVASLKMSGLLRGENHKNWRGGRWTDPFGYIRNPLYRGRGRSTVLEHRRLMAEHLGRPLEPNEIVHHINEIKTDNRIENLTIMTRSEHARLHQTLHKI